VIHHLDQPFLGHAGRALRGVDVVDAIFGGFAEVVSDAGA
jgi:hypothetical protein